MDKEELLKQVQLWTNNVPLVILGSGASIPYGLPSMLALGEYIKSNVKLTDKDDLAQFCQFIEIFDKKGDLESSLSELYLRQNVLDQIVCRTWDLISMYDLEVYETLLTKKIDFPLARLLDHLLSAAGKKVSIVTTNYDRLSEYAASFAKAFVCSGYSQNYIGHFASSMLSNNLSNLKGYKGQVNLWKVHGSIDWFRSQEDENIVQLPLRKDIPENFIPLIVTPGLSKYYETHNEPYRTILAQADNEIETANGFLCIGYGFNDIHVQPKLIEQIKKKKPIIVIAKKLTPKTIQTIIDANIKNYILIEEDGNNTKVLSSSFGEQLFLNESFWLLSDFLKLII